MTRDVFIDLNVDVSEVEALLPLAARAFEDGLLSATEVERLLMDQVKFDVSEPYYYRNVV